MALRPRSSLSTAAKRLVRRALGAASPGLLQRIDLARAHVRYRRDPRQGPKRLLLEPTTSCNYHCLMCTDHSPLLDSHVAAQVMPWEQIERLLRDAAAMGAEEIWLAGRGEPLLHPKITEIVALAASLGMHSMITTNGGRLNEALADQLCDAGLSQLSVSINSGSPNTYARVHGVPSEERTRILSVMRRVSARPRPPALFASMVVLKPNAPELLDFVRDGISAGADALDLLGLRNPGALHIPALGTLALDEEEWDRVRRDLPPATAMAREAGVELRMSGIPAKGEGTDGGPSHWRLGCFVGYLFLRIEANGNVNGCCSCENRLGSLAEASLAEVWRSQLYQRFRRECREMPATGRMPLSCACDCCGNAMDNVVAHGELGFRPLRAGREDGIATRLDLARIVWRGLGALLLHDRDAPGYADVTRDQTGPAWAAVVGLQSAGVMTGAPGAAGGLREFWPRRPVAQAEAAEVLRRCLATLGVPPDRCDELISSRAPKTRGRDALLESEVERWTRAVGRGLRKVRRHG